MANPSMLAVLVPAYLTFAVLWAGLGAWALADRDTSGGLLRLALAGVWLVLAGLALRRRRRDDSA